jgi:hypothetical protein
VIPRSSLQRLLEAPPSRGVFRHAPAEVGSQTGGPALSRSFDQQTLVAAVAALRFTSEAGSEKAPCGGCMALSYSRGRVITR